MEIGPWQDEHVVQNMEGKEQKKHLRDLEVAAGRELVLEEGRGGAADGSFRV